MKKNVFLFFLLVCFIIPAFASAEIPEAMSFQGFLSDLSGEPLDGLHNMTFTLYGSAEGSDVVWVQTLEVTVTSGTFSVTLGGGDNPLDANIFGDQPLWLGVKVDAGDELSPRQAIGSVPYAVRASRADNALEEADVQALLDQAGYLSEETDPNVNALGKADLACTAGEVAKWDGAGWVCAVDDTGTDTLAALSCPDGQTVKFSDGAGWICAADEGLLSESDPTVNALGKADLSCNNGEIVRYNGTGWECSAESLSAETDPVFTASAAAEVTAEKMENWDTAYSWGNHADAGYITDAYDDLSTHGRLDYADDDDIVTRAQLQSHYVAAAPLQLPRSNIITSMDVGNNVGYGTSITIGSDGLPVIAYRDNGNNCLKVMKCGNPACSAGNRRHVVDNTADVGKFCSIAIGIDGFPVISYYNEDAGNLRVAKCADHQCDSASINEPDASDNAGQYTSIAINPEGKPVVSYYDVHNGYLRFLVCSNAACSSIDSMVNVDTSGDVGQYSSVAIGTDGFPVIAYRDQTNRMLKVAKCNDDMCGAGTLTVTTVDNSAMNVGNYTSLTIGTDGLPIISYLQYDGNKLRVLKCGNAACSTGNTITIVDDAYAVGYDSAITIAPDGLPVIAYRNGNSENLLFVKCGNRSCSGHNNLVLLDDSANVGRYIAITIGLDGLPIISYQDFSSNDLKVLKCANPFCTPFWSRR